MKAVLQRVSEASVIINGCEKRAIRKGLMILLGIAREDSNEDIEWLCRKITSMRIFTDNEDKMNLSVLDIGGEILLISQFTLFASTKKGNRPSFNLSAPPEYAIPLFDNFAEKIKTVMDGKVKTGLFGAHMEVALVNDGPVTIVIDSQKRE